VKVPELVQNTASTILSRFGYELTRRKPQVADVTMEGAIGRARDRGISAATVLDVGAAQGKWTRTALRHFPDARYLLFDPLEERRPDLETLHLDHPNVDFVIAAAGAAPGTVSLTVRDNLDGSTVVEQPKGNIRPVPVTTIDAEIAARSLPAPYFLKLDTHGYELPILEGAAQTLRETSLLILETYNFRLHAGALLFHEMVAHLDTLGFRCLEIVDPLLRPKDQVLWQLDIVFVPKDSPLFARGSFR
jgi:FkbM family methyltransferase